MGGSCRNWLTCQFGAGNRVCNMIVLTFFKHLYHFFYIKDAISTQTNLTDSESKVVLRKKKMFAITEGN